ncbi:molybdate ABC transporter permease subunit [Pontibacter sp. G13]|uniref:molybdate ABC transporter permease subunit n=1 Tax=Pontibacter sp. G13 TaxID=3074898 RepID=UPI00288908ED|nr:molybdate ABC transporter permease subunit [Pontibacter sp. G13]WNJ20145.1 molybdate ABC transporter permease subunit [Pontibacter sp. G13]
MDWMPIWLSLKLACCTTLVLAAIAVPITYRLSEFPNRLTAIWKAVVSLPLVLPPTVLGYYLLMLLGPRMGLGKWLAESWDYQLLFTFEGLVIGSVLYSLPFMVNPILSALEGLPEGYRESAYTLGKSKWTTYWKVLSPNVRSAWIMGAVMAFAHTLGEFGVILMIGGNIPGETRVASLAIYHAVETLDYASANRYALILLVAAGSLMALVYVLQRRWNRLT